MLLPHTRLSVGSTSRCREMEAICETLVSAVSGVDAPKSFRTKRLKGSSCRGHSDPRISDEGNDVKEGTKSVLTWWETLVLGNKCWQSCTWTINNQIRQKKEIGK